MSQGNVESAGDECPTVSVIMPALNEAANLSLVLGRMPPVDELVLVDGGSTDATVAVAKALYPSVRVISQNRQGKGNALACGFAAATGDILVTLDADGSMDPGEIPNLIAQMLATRSDYAKGSRTIGDGGSDDLTRTRRLGNFVLRTLVNGLYDVRYTDLCYGLVAFWRSLLPTLGFPASTIAASSLGDGFEIETCLNIRAARAHLNVVEVPSYEHARKFGTSNLRVVRDGFRILGAIVMERRRPVPLPIPTLAEAAADSRREVSYPERPGSPVTVIGSGYVGTVVAACLAHLGRNVVVLENDATKLSILSQGESPVFEPGLQELLREGTASGKLCFTGSVGRALRDSEVVFVCVGSPLGDNGHADISALKLIGETIGQISTRRHVLVVKSTVPIGSGQLLPSILQGASGAPISSSNISVVSCPEFLREGSAVRDFLHPDRLVFGSNSPDAIDAVVDVYGPVLDQCFDGGDANARPVLIRTQLETAEMVKYAANAFLATKISFINEISSLCELLGADVTTVSEAMGLDSRIGPAFLQAGVGWGGSCLGKDLSELITTAADNAHDVPILRAVAEVNQRQRRVVIEKLEKSFGTCRGLRVCLLGLTFKPGTDDLRDAPALEIARLLIEEGAFVSGHDPMVRCVSEIPELRVRKDPYRAAANADAIVLVTEWPEFAALDLERLRSGMRGRLVIDGRNFLDPTLIEAAHFIYEGIGRRMVPDQHLSSDFEPGLGVPSAVNAARVCVEDHSSGALSLVRVNAPS